MKHEDSDKLKKLFEDIKNVSNRLEKLKLIGVEREIKEFGGSSHIIMNKGDIGKKAFVIILPELEKIK